MFLDSAYQKANMGLIDSLTDRLYVNNMAADNCYADWKSLIRTISNSDTHTQKLEIITTLIIFINNNKNNLNQLFMLITPLSCKN